MSRYQIHRDYFAFLDFVLETDPQPEDIEEATEMFLAVHPDYDDC